MLAKALRVYEICNLVRPKKRLCLTLQSDSKNPQDKKKIAVLRPLPFWSVVNSCFIKRGHLQRVVSSAKSIMGALHFTVSTIR